MEVIELSSLFYVFLYFSKKKEYIVFLLKYYWLDSVLGLENVGRGENMSDIITEKEMKISSRQIFRLAAVIYADDNPIIDTKEVIKSIVEACLYEKIEIDMSIDDILAYSMDQYFINFTYEEIKNVLDKYKQNFSSHVYNKCSYYRLTQKRIEEFRNEQQKNIEHYINIFLEDYPLEEKVKIQESIYKFLYELTTTNINSYKKMLTNGIHSTFLQDSELSVDQALFTEEEKVYISSFLDWDNIEKNNSIADIILCCLEYCLIVSGDSKNNLTETFIKNKTIYLDTNIIFRALGINGKNRKEVSIALLEKCRKGNVNICIALITEREFFNTIDYHISKISLYARGKLDTESYNLITDYSIYSFYNEWRQTHEGLSFRYFSSYIKSLYNELVQEFNIITDNKTPYNPFDDNEKSSITKYNSEIHYIKDEMKDRNYYYNLDEYTNGNTHDASLILWIERRREKNLAQVGRGDYYLISSDKSLRYWDLTRERDSSLIVIYPSHFFSILIKACGRAKNDLKSFVSFINLRPKGTTIQPGKADAILSGISVVTEDIATQRALIHEIMEEGLNDVLKDCGNEVEIYERTKLISMKYLENELKKKTKNITAAEEQIAAVTEKVRNLEYQNDIILQKEKARNDILENAFLKVAMKNTFPKYIFQLWIIPSLGFLYAIAFLGFIFLQFFFCDAEWNFVSSINEYVLTKTIIGKGGDFTLFAIDGILGLSFKFIYKKIVLNPFNKTKKMEFRTGIVEKYLEKNKLLD